MTSGFIDSASVYGILTTLDRRRPEHSYETEWLQALAVTCAVIETSSMQLAPSPVIEGTAAGAYGQLLSGLNGIIGRSSDIPTDLANEALRKTKEFGPKEVTTIERVRSSVSHLEFCNGPELCSLARCSNQHRVD